MIVNAAYNANRYLNVHLARKFHVELQDTLASGGEVVVSTYTRATRYQKKHAGMIRVAGHRVQVQSGKSWNTIMEGGRLLVCVRMTK